MTRKLASFLLFFVLVCSFFLKTPLSSEASQLNFEWPVPISGLSELITSTFGESRMDHYHNGLDISSVNQPISALEAGQILYSHYKEDNPFEDERGSGNIVWLSHSGGYISGYYHLAGSRHENIRKKTDLEKGETLGYSGNTGHSTGGHLHFVLGKDFGKTLLDPMAYLPPIEDNMPPQIASLLIHVGDSKTNINDGDAINVSTTFPLTVSIIDAGVKKSQRRGVQSVKFTFNGENIKEASFSSLRFENGKWLTTNGLTFEDLFFKDRYLVGNLNLRAGENQIKVTASDFKGLKAERSFGFTVQRLATK